MNTPASAFLKTAMPGMMHFNKGANHPRPPSPVGGEGGRKNLSLTKEEG